MHAEPLLSLAATVAGEHRTEDVLTAIVRGLAAQPGVALARIWLLAPGDICDSCFLRSDCANQEQCLHLAASAGTPLHSGDEDWSFLQGRSRRIPLNYRKVGHIASTSKSVLIAEFATESEWFVNRDWALREEIRGFAGHALIHRGEVLGVLGVFSRELLSGDDFAWLKMFAGQAAVAIENARAFEELVCAQAELRERESQLKQVMDVVPHHMYIMQSDGTVDYRNWASKDFFPLLGPMKPRDFALQYSHPDDFEHLWSVFQRGRQTGTAVQAEGRMTRGDGQYRWFLHQLFPLLNEEGRIIRWCGTRIDIDDLKRSQERAELENVALRDEIDKASMFEEIVGTSPRLRAVLARVAKVAESDSTVLITGETGTGKELIARAIHRRSPRSSRAFVSVNCAAIPRDLVASELFGHEKGAFTGALQRRLGRFELAEGGTIFLDEIGELPPETQIALLRVLQEREFQRVGSNQSLRADVRVIAATHRDLPAAIEAGSFRSDLYYRINVFPIEVPPLRERKEDVRLLIEYFISRYSSKAGKTFRKIDKCCLDRLQAYPWPGNIRELQNVIERSVILCEGQNFSVDESWLTYQSQRTRSLPDDIGQREKQAIEDVLAASDGRISGASGAAVKLGIPPSTLDSKIKALKIDKRRFFRGPG